MLILEMEKVIGKRKNALKKNFLHLYQFVRI